MPVDNARTSSFATRVDGLVPTEPARPARLDLDAADGPAKIGRYVVLRKLGEGGMGVVYAAYDDQLERKVAIKLLRGDFRGRQQSVGQARLQREAQSMAKLSHPNVAQVYEVGTIADAVFIAMEFVSGGSLKDWLERQARPWRDVLDAYLQAARGLAAAHRAGIVHRDFKPDNVLLGEDGRVRVVDFGLARHHDASELPLAGEAAQTGVDLTQAGAFIGTPAYMAPEQLVREPAGALSDQFSFCVALFEGLHGYRPFRGETTAEISRAVLGNDRLDPPRDTRVPGWVHAALVRGLSVEPDRRFPTMDALIEVLSVDPDQIRRRRLGVAAAALGSTLFAGVGGWAAYALQAQDAATCSGARELLVGAWDPTTATAVHAALTAGAIAYAADVAARVDQRLIRYADAWVDMRTSACEAHRRGDQSDSLYDLRMTCLDDRRTSLRALVGVLSTPDAAVLEKAVQAVDQLPALSRCADTRALLAQSPPPDDPAVAQAVDALRTGLAEARAKFDVGQFKAAQAELDPLRAQAEALAHAPTLALSLHLAGRVADALGDYGPAEATLRRAVATADRAADDDTRVLATIDLLRVVAVRQARFDEGLHLGELARGTIERLPDGRPAEALLEGRLGDLYLQRGDLERAEPHITRAIDLRAQLQGETSSAYGNAVGARASLKFLRGDYEAALAEYQRTLAIYEQAYGANHPALGEVLNNIGATQLTLARFADARATFTRTLGLLRGAYGDSHPALATVHSNLGMIDQLEGRYPESLAAFAQAMAIYDAHLPPNHPNRGDCLLDLGNTHLFAGQPAAAEAAFSRALEIYGTTFDGGHVKVIQALASLGRAQLRGGHTGEAERTFRRAIDSYGGDVTGHARSLPLAGLGYVELATGREAQAVPHLEQALELMPKDPVVLPYDIAEVRFALARALRRRDPERARQLAQQARSDFLGAGAAYERAVAEVDAWLTASAG